jgi:hypothetical protein
MTKLKSLFLGAACLTLLVFAVSFLTSTPAPAAPPPPPTPSIPVSVVNPALTVQGTVNANITNGSVPVSVSSLPAVTLSGTTAVSIPSNSAFAPLYVEPEAFAAVNNHGAECENTGPLSPYQNGQNSCSYPVGITLTSILVVDGVSVFAQVPAGTVVQNAFLGPSGGGGVMPYAYLVPVKVSTDGTSDYYVAQSPIKTYFGATAQIGCGITTNPNANTTPFDLHCAVNSHTVPGGN